MRKTSQKKSCLGNLQKHERIWYNTRRWEKKALSQNKHRDIFETLKRDILDGKYEAGKPLPSAPALMRRLGVARATVDRAMSALEHEGLVEKRKGSGTYPVKREPITFGVIVPEAGRPFYARVCEGIANFANNAGGGYIRCYGRMRRLRKPRSCVRTPSCALNRESPACSSRARATGG